MQRLPNIAFIGPAGAGKTTAANFLVEQYGYQRLSFAAPLKSIAGKLWPDNFGRDELQKLGVAVRDIHENTWSDLLRREIRSYEGSYPLVIDDCRFPNEWAMLKGENFMFIRLTVGRQQQIGRLTANGRWQSEEQLEHVSETALNVIAPDGYADSDNGIEHVQERIVDYVERWTLR